MHKLNFEDSICPTDKMIKKFNKPEIPPNLLLNELPILGVNDRKIKKRLPVNFLEARDDLKQYPFYMDLINYSEEISDLFRMIPHSGRKGSNIIYFLYRFFTINQISTEELADEIKTVMPTEVKKMTKNDNFYFKIWNNICQNFKKMPENTLLANTDIIVFTKIINLTNIFRYGSTTPVGTLSCISSFLNFFKKKFQIFKNTLIFLFQTHTSFYLSQTSTRIQKLTHEKKHKTERPKLNDLSEQELFIFLAYFIFLIKDISASLLRFISNYEAAINHVFLHEYSSLIESPKLPRITITDDFALEDIPFLIFNSKSQRKNVFINNSSSFCLLKPFLQKLCEVNLKDNPIFSLYFQEFIKHADSAIFLKNYHDYSHKFLRNYIQILTFNHKSLFEKNNIITELIKEALNLPNNIPINFSEIFKSLIASNSFIKSQKNIQNLSNVMSKDSAICDFFKLKYASIPEKHYIS